MSEWHQFASKAFNDVSHSHHHRYLGIDSFPLFFFFSFSFLVPSFHVHLFLFLWRNERERNVKEDVNSSRVKLSLITDIIVSTFSFSSLSLFLTPFFSLHSRVEERKKIRFRGNELQSFFSPLCVTQETQLFVIVIFPRPASMTRSLGMFSLSLSSISSSSCFFPLSLSIFLQLGLPFSNHSLHFFRDPVH